MFKVLGTIDANTSIFKIVNERAKLTEIMQNLSGEEDLWLVNILNSLALARVTKY